MTDFNVPQDPAPRDSDEPPSARRFRLVGETAGEGDPSDGPAGAADPGDRWSALSRKLLTSEAVWRDRWTETPDGMTLVRASIPMLSAISRIRSEADAALALTTVLEVLSIDAWVGMPCAVLGDIEFGLVVPEGIAVESIAETIDEALQAQVRSTDLQGPLRDRYRARVELL